MHNSTSLERAHILAFDEPIWHKVFVVSLDWTRVLCCPRWILDKTIQNLLILQRVWLIYIREPILCNVLAGCLWHYHNSALVIQILASIFVYGPAQHIFNLIGRQLPILIHAVVVENARKLSWCGQMLVIWCLLAPLSIRLNHDWFPLAHTPHNWTVIVEQKGHALLRIFKSLQSILCFLVVLNDQIFVVKFTFRWLLTFTN